MIRVRTKAKIRNRQTLDLGFLILWFHKKKEKHNQNKKTADSQPKQPISYTRYSP